MYQANKKVIMKKRQIIDNRKYILARDDYRVFYAIKRRGNISIWINVEGEDEDRRVLDEDFKDVYLCSKKVSYGYMDYCYLFLRNKDDQCSIIDITSLEVVKQFDFQELMKKYRRTINEDNEDGEGIQDYVIILWNKEKKVYSIWSLLKGYIFEPYEYTTIEIYSEGVILDGKNAVDNCGCSLDISDYEEITGPVYYNKKNDKYLFLVDEDGVLFDLMREKGEEGNIFEIETNYNIYTFNSETQELKSSSIPPDDYYDLSKYSDIAYEGYSRLYLGLED